MSFLKNIMLYRLICVVVEQILDIFNFNICRTPTSRLLNSISGFLKKYFQTSKGSQFNELKVHLIHTKHFPIQSSLHSISLVMKGMVS